jgi:hypothetical protein
LPNFREICRKDKKTLIRYLANSPHWEVFPIFPDSWHKKIFKLEDNALSSNAPAYIAIRNWTDDELSKIYGNLPFNEDAECVDNIFSGSIKILIGIKPESIKSQEKAVLHHIEEDKLIKVLDPLQLDKNFVQFLATENDVSILVTDYTKDHYGDFCKICLNLLERDLSTTGNEAFKGVAGPRVNWFDSFISGPELEVGYGYPCMCGYYGQWHGVMAKVNPGEPGVTYIRCFDEETQKEYQSAPSAFGIDYRYCGWSDNKREVFPNHLLFKTQKGDKSKIFDLQVQVWFKPDSGEADRCLISKRYLLGAGYHG